MDWKSTTPNSLGQGGHIDVKQCWAQYWALRNSPVNWCCGWHKGIKLYTIYLILQKMLNPVEGHAPRHQSPEAYPKGYGGRWCRRLLTDQVAPTWLGCPNPGTFSMHPLSPEERPPCYEMHGSQIEKYPTGCSLPDTWTDDDWPMSPWSSNNQEEERSVDNSVNPEGSQELFLATAWSMPFSTY